MTAVLTAPEAVTLTPEEYAQIESSRAELVDGVLIVGAVPTLCCAATPT